MNLLGLKKSQVINLMYNRQRKKTLTKAQIKRAIDLLLKVANDPRNAGPNTKAE